MSGGWAGSDCQNSGSVVGMNGCRGPGQNDSPTCSRPIKYRGYCSGHAEQRRLGYQLTPLRSKRKPGEIVTCSYPRCDKHSSSIGLCWGHYEQHKRGQTLRPLSARRPTGSSFKRDAEGRKHCSVCDTWKPLDQFTGRTGKADGYHYKCRLCVSEGSVSRKYNIPVEMYRRLLLEQEGRCLICNDELRGGVFTAVDHDHGCCSGRESCGACVRGVLCSKCNGALGMMNDDPALLRAAAAYLEGRR